MFPVTVCLGLLILGSFLLVLTRRKKAGKVFVLLGVLLLGLFSFEPLPNFLLRSLECRYPPLLNLENIQSTRWIVVLGGGYASDRTLPAASQLSGASLARLAEGIRIHRGQPGSKLVLSGGKLLNPISEAEIMATVAITMGARSQDLILEGLSKDTEEEARLIRQIIGEDRFVLVTSASHMPRSMALFKKLEMNPIPAPTDYCIKENQVANPMKFYPRAENLSKAERACYEYLGLAWAKLRGKI